MPVAMFDLLVYIFIINKRGSLFWGLGIFINGCLISGPQWYDQNSSSIYGKSISGILSPNLFLEIINSSHTLENHQELTKYYSFSR